MKKLLILMLCSSTLFAQISSSATPTMLNAFIKLSFSSGTQVAMMEMDLDRVLISIPEIRRKEMPMAYPLKERSAKQRIAVYGGDNFHPGLDIKADRDTPILVTGDGEVILTGYDPVGLGNYILVQHTRGFYSLYSQLDKVIITEGTIVQSGETIGLLGNTGKSKEPHLGYFVLLSEEIPQFHSEEDLIDISLDPGLFFFE